MTEPTDAEIIALAISEGIKVRTGAGVVKLARAVLAKWGTPPPTTAEFALQALVAAGHVSQELVDKALALPGAPQPVVREPLTDEQLWANDEIMSLNADLGWHMDTIRMFTRVIERAHGIKGGQHGTDN